MMLAPHSARRVETRRAEWARRSWSAQLRRSSDSVAAPSQQRRAALQPSTQLVVFVASLLEVLLAAPRGGTRRWDDHL